jgi:chromate transporter
LRGINAAVVGLLLAVLYQTAWTAAILNASHFARGLAAFALLAVWSVPPWLVVVLTAIGVLQAVRRLPEPSSPSWCCCSACC